MAKSAFAVWVTGLPSSGKSTITAALKSQLEARGLDPAVLESDELRRILTPHPAYDEQERETFYAQMVFIGELLARHGVPVIFDATANRRRYRDEARRRIPRFLEVFVNVPLKVCMARDPKGIYRQARREDHNTVPGLQAAYEPPENPEVTVSGEPPPEAARLVIAKLEQNGWLTG